MHNRPETTLRKLIIDLGNTRAKVAVFEGNQLIDLSWYENQNPEQLLQPCLEKHTISAGIISSVSVSTEAFRGYFANIPFIEFNSSTPVPIHNHYQSPATLGVDRLAAAVAASRMFPKKNVLIIDAGTAITYDFINSKAEYLGGGITAGVSLRFRSLNNYTSRLPLAEAKFPEHLIGRTSEESIQSGIMYGIRAELDGIIQEYIALYPDLITLFTGGDMIYFEKKMKNDIFAIPNLVLTGLNLILDYNLEN